MDNGEDLVRGMLSIGGIIVLGVIVACVGIGVLIGAALF
jgi:hypothetical protein